MSKAVSEKKITDLEAVLKTHAEGTPEWCDIMLEIARLKLLQPA